MNNEFCLLIKEICKENNIECDVLSTGWILSLNKNGVRRFISGYKFDNNMYALGQIFDDKFATYELLKSCKIPVCEHNILYSESNHNAYAIGCNTFSYVLNLFNKYNSDIVIKINNGTCGINVNRFRDLETLREFFESLNAKSSFSICPFYNIKNEYRVIILNNEVKLVYKKKLPEVIGNGHSTIKELLLQFNLEYFKNINDKSLNRILKKGERFSYGWKFNLSAGSLPSFDIDEMDKKIILDIVSRIIENISVGFCSIDIIKTIGSQYLVMEINSGVMMKNFMMNSDENYNIAKNIYTKAILKMFEE